LIRDPGTVWIPACAGMTIAKVINCRVNNLFFAGLSGAAIPLLMKRIGIDPAQSANIILTTITDVIGFFAFLGFAVLFQSYLV